MGDEGGGTTLREDSPPHAAGAPHKRGPPPRVAHSVRSQFPELDSTSLLPTGRLLQRSDFGRNDMELSLKKSISGLALAGLFVGLPSCSSDPCGGQCDPATEFCAAQASCAFIPFEGPASGTCVALPEECIGADATCECFACSRSPECLSGLNSECIEEQGVALVLQSGCE